MSAWVTRFGLRTLLVATTIFSVWLGLYVHRVRRQKAAVAAIRDYGGWVHYDFQEAPAGSLKFDVQVAPNLPVWLVNALGEDFFYDVLEVNLVYSYDSGQREDNINVSGDVLEKLVALPEVRQLLICKGQATDEGLKYVATLRKLESLYMWGPSEITDAGVAHLAGLPKLTKLHLSKSRVSDESLKTLGRLPSLEKMTVQGNKFTDAGLAYLQGNQRLRSLWLGLGETDITDKGMPYLSDLINLEELDLQGTNVTTEGLAHLTRLTKLTGLFIGTSKVGDTQAFEQALPNCRVSR